jgi:hypothetical protein
MTPSAPAARPQPSPRGGAAGVAAIVLGASLIAAVVGPGGEFPLSDDWAYAYTTRGLCQDGVIRFLPWTGASVVAQVWYGAALCRLFGFSFEVLRASTLVLATLGAVVFFLMLGRLGVRGAARALATAVFALCPLYVNLAFTFMTDVPFVVSAVFAGYAYVRGLDQRAVGWLLLGAACAAIALLVRQHGIFVALAAGLAACLDARGTRRERFGLAAAATALPVIAFIAFQVWLFAWHGAPAAVANKMSEARATTVAGLANCAFRGLAYLGLLLAPLAAAVWPEARRRGTALVAVACMLAAPAAALWLREGATMFYLTNVMYDLGLGASSLRDTLFLALPPPVEAGLALRLPLTVIALAGAAVLLVTWTSALRRRWHEPVPAFLTLATLLLFAGTLLHARFYFDRYLLAVVPFAIAAGCVAGGVRPAAASVALMALLGWYAVAGTHDYLAWNRARHAGLAELRAQGVPVTEIDGGVEFNAWHLSPALDRWPTNDEARPGQPAWRKSWWWVVDDRFVASFHPLAGYGVRDRRPYARWLVPGTGEVLILERAAGS